MPQPIPQILLILLILLLTHPPSHLTLPQETIATDADHRLVQSTRILDTRCLVGGLLLRGVAAWEGVYALGVLFGDVGRGRVQGVGVYGRDGFRGEVG